MPQIRLFFCILFTLIFHTCYAKSDLPFALDYKEKCHFGNIAFPKSIKASDIEEALSENSWARVKMFIDQGFGKSFTISDLIKLSQHNSHLKRALLSYESIGKLPGTRLTKKEILLLTLFIEAELKNYTKRKQNYIERKKSGLSKTVEFDPVTSLTFIHLGIEIGRGFQKIVTKSILYRLKNPEIVANCQTSYHIDREVNIMKKLKGSPGLVESYAFTKHCSGDKIFTSIFTKLYNRGSLQLVLDKHTKLTLKEKIGMAFNIMKGLHSLHRNNVTHRDLGARNYFVDIQNAKGSKKRIVKAVVADLGRAHYFSKLNKGSSVQGNKFYMAPEGFFPNKMRPRDYTYTDLYATGLVFYRLMYGKTAPWVNVRMNRDESVSRSDRSTYTMRKLKIFTDKKRTFLNKNRSTLSKSHKFLRLIYQMLHPNPKKRRTAREHCKTLHDLYKSM